MIKLIASDLDGTLLDDEKNLPSDFFDTLDMLLERNITFAAATGRTYTAADHLFPEKYLDKIAFICDNGACTYLGGKPVSVFELERPVFEELLKACDKIGGLKLVVCAESGVYHFDEGDDFSRAVGLFYRNLRVTDDFRRINDRIYKLAICDERGTYTHGKPALDEIMGDKLNVQVSGEVWMDVMASGVGKGRALRALMSRLGVSPDETAAFGDYFNDLDMLLSAKWNFCPENGHEEVKKQCRFICADSNHGGAAAEMRKIALRGEITV